LSGTTPTSQYQKGKTNLDFTEAKDREWQWHQLGHMQICTLPQTDNHASTTLLNYLHAGCPSCHPTNSVKALKAGMLYINKLNIIYPTRFFILYKEYSGKRLNRHIRQTNQRIIAHNPFTA